MTLPSLMTNTQEAQAKTAYKKLINTLTVAAQTNLAQDGYDFSSLKSGIGNIEEYTEDEMSLARMLGERTAVDMGKAKDEELITTAGYTVAHTVFFRDGSALLLPDEVQANAEVMQTDGLPRGLSLVYDINGTKAPNSLSNCIGNTNGAMDTDSLLANNPNTVDAVDDGGGAGEVPEGITCTKANRVIKDQFLVKLRGSVAQPDGAAAIWAYNN